jgi:hypothetical protein
MILRDDEILSGQHNNTPVAGFFLSTDFLNEHICEENELKNGFAFARFVSTCLQYH